MIPISLRIKVIISTIWAWCIRGDAIYVSNGQFVPSVKIARKITNPMYNTTWQYIKVRPNKGRFYQKEKRELKEKPSQFGVQWIYINKNKRTEQILKRSGMQTPDD